MAIKSRTDSGELPPKAIVCASSDLDLLFELILVETIRGVLIISSVKRLESIFILYTKVGVCR